MITMQKNDPPQLILASASPRRNEILRLLGLSFSVVVPQNVDEAQLHSDVLLESTLLTMPERARQLCTELASMKAKDVLVNNPRAVVIGADTVVVTSDTILGKPDTPDQARQMLRLMCGKPHYVYTGVSVQNEKKRVLFSSESIVHFHPADAKQLEWIDMYVQSGQPMDKAGAYGIQDFGAILIESIKGDYYSVMGLPISKLARVLNDFGYKIKYKN